MIKTQLRYILLCATLIVLGSYSASSQSLLDMADSANKATAPKPFLAPTWKDTRLMDVQTTKTLNPGAMEFFIMHRFGNIGDASGGGGHTFFGFDIASDILFAFDFGITKNFTLSIQRSKEQELIDITAKYKLLTQEVTGMPISLAVYGDLGITPERDAQLYAFADSSVQEHAIDRLSYFGEVIVDRRFNDHLALELLAGDQHRNYILANVNPSNGAADKNDIPFIALGGRVMLNKHSSIVFDAYYLFSNYRVGNTANPYYIPFSIGYEVETGGHVFQIYLANASFLDENNIIPNTTDNWANGGFKLGFSISRMFNIVKK